MNKPKVLVVDDEASIRHVLLRVLEMNGCEVREAESAEKGLEQLSEWEPEVCMIDIVLPGKNGIQLLGDIKQLYADTEVLVMTSNSSAETALQAIRRGAHDYLQKPFENLKDVWTNVQRALEKRNLTLKNRAVLKEQEQRTQELSSSVSLPETEEADHDTESIQEILDNFLDVVIDELDVERASLMLVNRRSNELYVVASRGIPPGLQDERVPLGEGIAGKVAETGESILVTDAAKDERVADKRPHLSASFISAPIAFSVPIKSEAEVFGVVNVTNRRSQRSFSSDDVAFLSGLAGQLGIVIEGAKRSDQLHKAYQSLRATQEQLVFSERIKAVGQMAAGVAHDFNNVLSVILARAEFALSRLGRAPSELDAVQADLETIIKTSLQGAETIKRIQDYTRIRKDTPNAAIALNDVIRDAVEIARPKWKEQAEAEGRHVEIDLRLNPIPKVSGNVYELAQVVNNLLFNAVEAMPDGGSITIETVAGDDCVTLVVRDNGTGMDEATRKKLFEPFFTTKESGQGLGTSIVFGIVSRHRGEIAVESAPGDGTTFTIRLPLMEASAEEAAPVTDGAVGEHVTAKILLVDDDETVRETNVEILSAGGHNVVSVCGGRQALEACGKESFDLVVTDLSMPGMSGMELATELKRIHADLPILLFSGWAVQEQEEKVREAGVDHILVKPCLMEDLLEAVQRAVASPIHTGVVP